MERIRFSGHRKAWLWVLCSLALCAPSACGENIAYEPGDRRDPFIPVSASDSLSDAASTGVKLEGIIYDPGTGSMAILNGKPYRAGEAAGEVTVVRIQKDHVVIAVSDEEKTLWIREEEKQPIL